MRAHRLLVLAALAILIGPLAARAQSAAPRRVLREDPVVLTTNPYVGTRVPSTDPRVSRYSTDGANNPYTTGGGRVVGADGQYLGKLNANRYDPESVANPYGQYGSKYSSTSINNPYSQYGSPYSATSATNPYATQAPHVYYGAPSTTTTPRASTYTPYVYTPYVYTPYVPPKRN